MATQLKHFQRADRESNRDNTASHGVDRERDEPLHPAAIAAALASAMVE
jgi:hypothetical protein